MFCFFISKIIPFHLPLLATSCISHNICPFKRHPSFYSNFMAIICRKYSEIGCRQFYLLFQTNYFQILWRGRVTLRSYNISIYCPSRLLVLLLIYWHTLLTVMGIWRKTVRLALSLFVDHKHSTSCLTNTVSALTHNHCLSQLFSWYSNGLDTVPQATK